MSIPQPPFKNRSRVYTSVPSAVVFSPAIAWIKVVNAGDVVAKDEAGTAVTYAGVLAGDVIPGPFTELTSTTSTKLWLGDGPMPPPSPASSAFSELYTDATSSQGLIQLKPSDFYLATGAPLAVFANGSSAVPGSSLTDSKAFCVRWNNNATLNAILASFKMPPDADITVNPTAHVRASKTGATSGDAVTFDIALFNNVDAALHDADSDFGGTTSAMTGAATAKTIQNVTLTITASNLAAFPASVTMTIKPTDGTLGTDDLCLLEVYILYKTKLRAS
jgi:hypothetical protein